MPPIASRSPGLRSLQPLAGLVPENKRQHRAIQVTGQKNDWISIDLFPTTVWNTPMLAASPHIPQPRRRVVFQMWKQGLLNVRHFAIDKDYLQILVDEDLLCA
jgi:hypothetical protein